MKARCAALFAFLLLIPFADLASHTVARSTAACTTLAVPVSVTNKSGQPVEGLTAANFKARFRGKTVRVLSAKLNRGPRRVLLMLDESGSMESSPGKWHLAVAAVAYFALYLNSRDTLSYMSFAAHPHEVPRFGLRRAYLLADLARIDSLREPNRIVWGPTSLWDSILLAARQFRVSRPGDAILVITDGDDNDSRDTEGQVFKALLSAHVRLFVFVPHYRRLGSYGVRESILAELVKTTGGEVVWKRRGGPREAPTANTAIGAINAWRTLLEARKSAPALRSWKGLLGQMEDFYEIDLPVPAGIPNKGLFKLKLSLVKGPMTKHLRLAYPRKLMACTFPSRQPNANRFNRNSLSGVEWSKLFDP